MISFILCLFLSFALIHGTHQASLRSDSNFERPTHLRLLELEVDNSTFPVWDALMLQFGDWAFWITLVPFIGIAFMAWRQKSFYAPAAVGVLVAIIFFSYWMIPGVLAYGAWCFRAQIKDMINGNGSKSTTVDQSHYNVIEMTTPLMPREEYLKERAKMSRRRNDRLSEPEKEGKMVASCCQKCCQCLFGWFKSSGKELGKKVLNDVKAEANQFANKVGKTLQTESKKFVNTIGNEIQAEGKKVFQDFQNNLQPPITNSRYTQPLDPEYENETLTVLGRYSSMVFDTAVFQNNLDWKDFTVNNYEEEMKRWEAHLVMTAETKEIMIKFSKGLEKAAKRRKKKEMEKEEIEKQLKEEFDKKGMKKTEELKKEYEDDNDYGFGRRSKLQILT